MRDLTFYIDKARQNSGATSDRKLSELIGMAPNTAFFWRSKKSFPSDDTMIRLAEIAQIDPQIALVELNAWRNHGTKAAPIYERMAAMLRGVVLTVVLALAFLMVTSDNSAHASQVVQNALFSATDNGANSNYVYYGKREYYLRQFTHRRPNDDQASSDLQIATRQQRSFIGQTRYTVDARDMNERMPVGGTVCIDAQVAQ